MHELGHALYWNSLFKYNGRMREQSDKPWFYLETGVYSSSLIFSSLFIGYKQKNNKIATNSWRLWLSWLNNRITLTDDGVKFDFEPTDKETGKLKMQLWAAIVIFQQKIPQHYQSIKARFYSYITFQGKHKISLRNWPSASVASMYARDAHCAALISVATITFVLSHCSLTPKPSLKKWSHHQLHSIFI